MTPFILSFLFSSRRRHTRFDCDWSSDVCSSELLREQSPDLRPGLVNGGGYDVRRRFTGELDDVFAEVGLHRLHAAARQRGVQVDLFGRHTLALDDRPRPPSLGDPGDDLACLRCVTRPMDPRAGALGVGGELLQVAVQAEQRLVLDGAGPVTGALRSEEHTSELQSQSNLVCRLLLEKKKTNTL